MDELNKKIFRSKCEEGWEWDLESLHKEEMCDYLISTGLYNKMELDHLYVKDMIDSDKTIPISNLVKRFIEIDKYYEGEPWNIRQILNSINIIIPVEDRKEKWEIKDNEHIIEKLKKLPNIGDTVYGIFRQTKIIPLTITGITFNDFGITLSAKNEEELGYSTINLLTDNTGMEWYKTYEEAEKSVKEILASRSLSKNKDVERI